MNDVFALWLNDIRFRSKVTPNAPSFWVWSHFCPVMIFSHLLTEAWMKRSDPAGIPPKILSSGSSKFFSVRVTFTINSTVLAWLGHFI